MTVRLFIGKNPQDGLSNPPSFKPFLRRRRNITDRDHNRSNDSGTGGKALDRDDDLTTPSKSGSSGGELQREIGNATKTSRRSAAILSRPLCIRVTSPMVEICRICPIVRVGKRCRSIRSLSGLNLRFSVMLASSASTDAQPPRQRLDHLVLRTERSARVIATVVSGTPTAVLACPVDGSNPRGGHP
jgi:hypothetical protein